MNNFSLSSTMCMCHKLTRGSRYLEDEYYTFLSSCCTLPLEGEQLRHPAQQWAGWAAKAELASTLLWKVFLPCSLVLCFWLLCKYCWVLLRWELVSSRMQRLGTASLQGKPSVHATSYTMMVQSMKHIISHVFLFPRMSTLQPGTLLNRLLAFLYLLFYLFSRPSPEKERAPKAYLHNHFTKSGS